MSGTASAATFVGGEKDSATIPLRDAQVGASGSRRQNRNWFKPESL
jgi:hypothetical protein